MANKLKDIISHDNLLKLATKILVIDVETTGVLYYRHSIHQISGMVVIDDVVQEKFNLFVRPHEKSEITDKALEIAGVTREQVMAYPHRTEQFNTFITVLSKYIDQYNPNDKFFILGFNNSYFDNEFIRNFFVLESDESFGVWFFQNTLDCMVLATQYLLPVRHLMPSFRLSRVAKYLGIAVKDESLHDAIYDCELTWEVYKVVKGKTIDDW